ncbi:hypothetical protein ZTR_08651 [Talaromyces verruculosus]|nr:hypothetical protein ZTR_08651 [Talaromyces verruculosus]
MELAQRFIVSEGLTDPEPIGQGLEFVVIKAKSDKHGHVALRVPKHKVFRNVNDPNTNAKQLIYQELKIYELLHGGPVPVPQPFCLLEIRDYPAMLSEYVHDDGSELHPAELGRLAALIHSTQLPLNWDVELAAMEGTDVLTALVQRVLRRFGELAREDPRVYNWALTKNDLQPITARLRHLPSCLLHMDLRDANLRICKGKPVAVIDWTNALIGPAAVDFFRIVELSQPGDAFINGYSSIKSPPEVTLVEEAFLRLDAALMIALVFVSEAPDEKRKGRSIRRVEELAHILQPTNNSA